MLLEDLFPEIFPQSVSQQITSIDSSCSNTCPGLDFPLRSFQGEGCLDSFPQSLPCGVSQQIASTESSGYNCTAAINFNLPNFNSMGVDDSLSYPSDVVNANTPMYNTSTATDLGTSHVDTGSDQKYPSKDTISNSQCTAVVKPSTVPPTQAVLGEDQFSDSSVLNEPSVASTAARIAKGTRARGRSLGENSSRAIKSLREQANNGDVDAALKLGWSVRRVTELFNKHKAARGVKVVPDQPIDDPILLSRIKEKHRYQAKIQKRRQEKLREQAYAGDLEAARKIKLGKRKMAELFPSENEEKIEHEDQFTSQADIVAGDHVDDSDVERKYSSADIVLPEVARVDHRRSPAEPFDYGQDRLQYPCELAAQGSNMQPVYNLISMGTSASTTTPWTHESLGAFPFVNMSSSAAEPISLQTPPQSQSPSSRNPQEDTGQRRLALCYEYTAAIQQVTAAKTNLARVARALEEAQAAEVSAVVEGQRQEVEAAKQLQLSQAEGGMTVKLESGETDEQGGMGYSVSPKRTKKIKTGNTRSRGKKERLESNFPIDAPEKREV